LKLTRLSALPAELSLQLHLVFVLVVMLMKEQLLSVPHVVRNSSDRLIEGDNLQCLTL
jgi:hypothetical protein